MKKSAIILLLAAGVPSLRAQSGTAAGGDSMSEIATKLNNPVASLISIPLQSNFDFGGGPNDDGFQFRLNLQPVIPFKISEDWKILSRTIIPYIDQDDRIGTTSQSGLGDSTVTLWLAPEKAESVHWGIGPVFQFPTATDDLLGSEKWGAGPSALLLRQSRGWTIGFLANHLWSFAGEEARDDISLTSFQPFLNYQTPSHTTIGGNVESGYDWEAGQWTVPLNLFVSQLVKIGNAPVSLQLGGRYYLEKPEGGSEWGLRFTVTFVLPE